MQAVIQDAADILKNDGWTTLRLGETAQGIPCSATDPEATKRCVLGALQYAFDKHDLDVNYTGTTLSDDFENVLSHIRTYIGMDDSEDAASWDLWDEIAEWNNTQDNAGPVIEVLEQAAKDWRD